MFAGLHLLISNILEVHLRLIGMSLVSLVSGHKLKCLTDWNFTWCWLWIKSQGITKVIAIILNVACICVANVMAKQLIVVETFHSKPLILLCQHHGSAQGRVRQLPKSVKCILQVMMIINIKLSSSSCWDISVKNKVVDRQSWSVDGYLLREN